MSASVAVIEPQPHLKAEIEAYMREQGFRIVAPSASPDVAVVLIDAPVPGWRNTVTQWLTDDRTAVVATVLKLDTIDTLASIDAVKATVRRPFRLERLADVVARVSIPAAERNLAAVDEALRSAVGPRVEVNGRRTVDVQIVEDSEFEGLGIEDESEDLPLPQQYALRAFRSFEMWQRLTPNKRLVVLSGFMKEFEAEVRDAVETEVREAAHVRKTVEDPVQAPEVPIPGASDPLGHEQVASDEGPETRERPIEDPLANPPIPLVEPASFGDDLDQALRPPLPPDPPRSTAETGRPSPSGPEHKPADD